MRFRLSRGLSPCRPGGLTPLAVLSLTLLVGVIAIAVDGGTLMEHRRHAQATADAAALAAAADLYTHYAANKGADPSNTASASAKAIALANGFNNDGVNSIVTVSISPQNYQDGPNKGKALPPGYAEVIIQYNAGRMFSNVFGSSAIPVRARAVACGQWEPVSDDVIALNLTASSTVSLSGGSSLNLKGSLRINSTSSSALAVSGTGTITASQYNLNAAGGTLTSSLLSVLSSLGGSSPIVNYGPPVADPLRFLPDPDPVALGLSLQGTNVKVKGGKPVDLYPGVYNGGITLSGGATAILHANANGSPGIYYLQGGGFNVSGPSTVMMAVGETAGVMLYNDWSRSQDVVNLAGTGFLSLSPPVSGTYKGISIFQKRGTITTSGPPVAVSGRTVANVAGTIYAAYALVCLSNTGAANTLGGQVISDSLSLTGGATININRGNQPVAPTRSLGLVE